jgi:DNA polymerase III subunit epsilon
MSPPSSFQEPSVSGYTVIDLETTGFSAAKHHRIIEIGVVELDPSGRIEDEWSTLLNPGRDIGNTHVHGITATDVASAPGFGDVVERLLDSVRGRTLVAHNAPFDLGFLGAELTRAGVTGQPLPLPGLCTMQWSAVFLEAPSRRLADCCLAGGISLDDAHTALGDARATAALLGHYLSLLEGSPELPWQDVRDLALAYSWPSPVPSSGRRLLPREAARSVRPDSWLDGILSRMPRSADVRVDAYLETLERALLDNILAEHEKSELVDVAQQLGLSRGQVLDLHATYLAAMAEVALADRVVTPQERADLETVAAVLGLRSVDVDRALADAEHSRSTAVTPAAERMSAAGLDLVVGDRIVFTGAMARDRASWEEFARSCGWVPGAVTRKTRLVVASDPNSQSGKAAKARSYGIPIISEEAFARLVGA